MEDKQCKDCEYAEKTPEYYAIHKTHVECHRHPPKESFSSFLCMRTTEWCGEFVRSEEKRD